MRVEMAGWLEEWWFVEMFGWMVALWYGEMISTRAGLRVDSVEGVVAVLMDGRRSDEVVDSMDGWMIGEEVG